MNQNIFEELQSKKQKLVALAQKAADYGWIPKQKTGDGQNTISLEEIKEKLESDTLTIGVIGQMKCGKSTFLNSFVFKDDVLPAATTPMTAALSIITYGEKERVVAEFYTKDEWAEQKMQASRDEKDAANAQDASKIKAAKELVSKATKLGASLDSYLGKIYEDNFSNLIEYVSAEGKFVSITKSVTIYYPHEYLKGVEVVDTPGFNDPIVSREERTKEFLKKADVVIMMLYAGRPFDATDKDIIFKNVRQCGIGKVLVGINKYDIPAAGILDPTDETGTRYIKLPEDEEQIKEYVKTEIKKACRECNDNTLVEILSDVEPIPLSAEMALLSELPMSKISSSEVWDSAWKRHSSSFGISSQAEMYKLSHLDNFVAAVKRMVEDEKDKILFAKPLNAILAAGDKIKADIDNELSIVNSKIELLAMPNADIDEKEENLSKAHRRLSKKINSLGEDLDTDIQNLVRKGKNELEDIVDAACRNLTNVIENEWGTFKSIDSIKPRLNGILQKLVTRDLKRASMNLADEGKNKIKRSISDFFADAEEQLMKCLPEFDSRDFVKSTQNKVQMDMDSSNLFVFDNSDEAEEEFSWGGLFGDVVNGFLTGYTFGGWTLAKNAFTHGDIKQEALQWVNSISSEFDPDPYLQSAFSRKDAAIESVKQSFITDLIEPLQKQIQEIRSGKDDKEKELHTAKARSSELADKKELLTKQMQSIAEMKQNI